MLQMHRAAGAFHQVIHNLIHSSQGERKSDGSSPCETQFPVIHYNNVTRLKSGCRCGTSRLLLPAVHSSRTVRAATASPPGSSTLGGREKVPEWEVYFCMAHEYLGNVHTERRLADALPFLQRCPVQLRAFPDPPAACVF